MIIKGEKYEFDFSMLAIRGIWKELGVRTLTDAQNYIRMIWPDDGTEGNMVDAMEFAAVCAFHGIKNFCIKKNRECPVDSVQELESHVQNFHEISPALHAYSTAMKGFYAEEPTGKKKKAANQSR
jgi:hypothetical protein